jgi:NAD(P)H-hydrate epimerase
MSRLTGRPISEIQSNRLATAQEFATAWGKVVVLKGAGTVIASSDGRAVVNPTGGPNLATAGTGDVLSGIIGGLLAQGCDPFRAAVAGVYLHGRAGDFLRREHGDAGTVAGDLLPVLPTARVSILEHA